MYNILISNNERIVKTRRKRKFKNRNSAKRAKWNIAITINLLGFIGSNPAKYVNKSFGVPGSKNRINIIYSICFGCVNNLLFSIF